MSLMIVALIDTNLNRDSSYHVPFKSFVQTKKQVAKDHTSWHVNNLMNVIDTKECQKICLSTEMLSSAHHSI